METSLSQLPDLGSLTAGLACVLAHNVDASGHLTVLDRKPAVYASTSSSETVTCRLGTGSILQLFCKYAAGRNHNAYGHRGGLERESEVYRFVLQPLEVSAPRFYGTHREATTG